MGNIVYRIRHYFRKHGPVKLLMLTAQRLWRTYIHNSSTIYYLDTHELSEEDSCSGPAVVVERHRSADSIPEEDLRVYSRVQGGRAMVFPILERFFVRGADFWLAKRNGEFVGCHWSITGGFEGFYFFPLTKRECVLVAGEVFPEYRGQGVNPAMIRAISRELRKDGITRIYIGSKVWNRPQLRSLPKTGFHMLGTAKSFLLFGSRVTIWRKRESFPKGERGVMAGPLRDAGPGAESSF